MIVAKFLSWMETAPVERRAEATGALARAYLFSHLSSDEREMAESALTLLLDDPSSLVRLALSEALASSPYTPRQLVLSLVQDQDEIAAPMLQRSPVLLDVELVDLIAKRSEPLQTAIALRPALSASLSAALAEVGCVSACVAMLGNAGAQITTFSLRRLAERFGSDGQMRTTLLAMPGLPLDIRQTLIVHLGDALQQLALVQTFVSSDRRDALVKDATDKATIDLAFTAEGDDLSALVEHLRLSGQLTADILIRGLCMGNVELFIMAMVSLSGMSERRVRECVVDASDGVVKAMCKKAGLAERVVPAIASSLQAYQDLTIDFAAEAGRPRFAKRMVDRILSEYALHIEDEMDDLYALLRRFATQIARDEARQLKGLIQKANAA